MTIREVFTNIADRLHENATVQTVYGEPIVAEGKTIIPVARVRFGFGGGGGTQQERTDNDSSTPAASGGGGGGGAEVSPVGFIEITAGETRYVSIEDRRKVVRTALLALLIGLFLLRRRRRRA